MLYKARTSLLYQCNTVSSIYKKNFDAFGLKVPVRLLPKFIEGFKYFATTQVN